MRAVDRQDEPVARLKSALEFLRCEAQRLNLEVVAIAIGHVLDVLCKPASAKQGQRAASAAACQDVVDQTDKVQEESLK